MSGMLSECVRLVTNCLYGDGEWTGNPHIPASQPIPDVILDTTSMGKWCISQCHSHQIVVTLCPGQEAVVVKNGLRVCGTGSVKGSAPILQVATES